MVELKVRKFGNSLGVILPKDVIKRLHAKDGEQLLLVEEANEEYRLSRSDPGFKRKMDIAEDIMNRYSDTLRALAE